MDALSFEELVIVLAAGFIASAVFWVMVPLSERYATEASSLSGDVKDMIFPFIVP
jgi:hypothetical protein